MSNHTIKKCRSCGKKVDPNHTGECPYCKKQEGYDISVTINEVVEVGDVIDVYKESMKDALKDAFERYDELEKQYEKNSEVLKKIKIKRKKLESQQELLFQKAESDAISDATKTKTFSIGAVIGTDDQRKEFLLNNIKSEIQVDSEKTTRELIEEVLLNQSVSDEKIESINDRLSPKQTILFGLGIGILGSIIGGLIVVLMTGSVGIVPTEHSEIITFINVTNSTYP